MQGKVIQFPSSSASPNYTGRVLALNLEKARRFQCGGFFLGGRQPWSMVAPEAQMDRIHQGVLSGVLVDITDTHKKGTRIGGTEVGAVTEEKTTKKVYISFMPGGMGLTGCNMPTIITAAEGVDGEEAQTAYESKLVARQPPLISLPPGMDDPDKYLLPVNQPCK